MKVALYARVSTCDKDQDPELRFVPMREYAGARGWDVTEYVDAGEVRGGRPGRPAWRRGPMYLNGGPPAVDSNPTTIW